MLTNFNEFRDLCHSTSVACGWWKNAENKPFDINSDGNDGVFDPDRLNIPTKIALVHTEIREAHDYYLSGENDDHLPHLPGAPVELGDVIIRVGDTAGYLAIDMDAAISEVAGEFRISEMFSDIEWADQAHFRHESMSGATLFVGLHNFAADATEAFRRGKLEEFARSLARIVVLCNLICEHDDWDLLAISREKVAYNAVREDHKAQVRAAEGGKAF